jgi:BirA family biotin operon repressor/biotin-[acetyl-CoA-carboxylase] ligase
MLNNHRLFRTLMSNSISYDIDEDSINAVLETKVIGLNIVYLHSVESTMDIARDLAEDKVPEGTLVIAEEQTKGRGRFNRVWISPAGENLHMSLILYPEMSYLSQIGMVCSLAIAKALRSFITEENKITIKWPNDVRVGAKKIAGILIENNITEGIRQVCIAGIGLNINSDTQEFPDISSASTSIAMELGNKVDRLEVIKRVLMHFEELYFYVQSGGRINDEWASFVDTIGKHIKLVWGENSYEGYAEGIDDDGSLRLLLANGDTLSLNAGEVTFQL